MHGDPARRKGERDAPGPHAQFERPTASGELGEDLDGRLHDARVEHLRAGQVVPRRHGFVEVTVVVRARSLAGCGNSEIEH